MTNLSSSLRNFITKMIFADAAQRLSFEELLADQWILAQSEFVRFTVAMLQTETKPQPKLKANKTPQRIQKLMKETPIKNKRKPRGG